MTRSSSAFAVGQLEGDADCKSMQRYMLVSHLQTQRSSSQVLSKHSAAAAAVAAATQHLCRQGAATPLRLEIALAKRLK